MGVKRLAAGLVFAVVTLGACTGLMLRGGKSHKGAPANAVARFTVPECRDLASGARLAGTSSYFFMAPGAGGFELFEVEQNNRATRITNYWKDDRGHNWQVYVRNREAWHYIIPDDQKQVGYRYVFAQDTHSFQGTNENFRLSGQPQIECWMIPVDAQGKPLATPPTPGADAGPEDAGAEAEEPVVEPEDAGVCTPGATQECIGPAACKGGQACLPEGTGFSPCDCGGEIADAGSDAL